MYRDSFNTLRLVCRINILDRLSQSLSSMSTVLCLKHHVRSEARFAAPPPHGIWSLWGSITTLWLVNCDSFAPLIFVACSNTFLVIHFLALQSLVLHRLFLVWFIVCWFLFFNISRPIPKRPALLTCLVCFCMLQWLKHSDALVTNLGVPHRHTISRGAVFFNLSLLGRCSKHRLWSILVYPPLQRDIER